MRKNNGATLVVTHQACSSYQPTADDFVVNQQVAAPILITNKNKDPKLQGIHTVSMRALRILCQIKTRVHIRLTKWQAQATLLH